MISVLSGAVHAFESKTHCRLRAPHLSVAETRIKRRQVAGTLRRFHRLEH